MKKLALLIVSSVILAGCSLTATAPTITPAPTATPAAVTTEASPTPPASPVAFSKGTVEVKGLNFSFDTKEIRVKKGDKLTVKFTNTEGFHDFIIDELGVTTKPIPQGTSEEVTIPTDKVGTYVYYCGVGNHRAQGMEGKLIIE